MQEQAPNGEFVQAWKFVRLVSADKAVGMGFATESPIFVSPYVDKEKTCHSCKANFSPIHYRQDGLVMAHHYHPGGGGIYHVAGRVDLKYLERVLNEEFYGWVAHFDLQESQYDFILTRAQVVNVRKITAHCAWEHKGYEEVTTGFLLEGSDGNIRPYCQDFFDKFDGLCKPDYGFRIEGGQVLFSQI